MKIESVHIGNEVIATFKVRLSCERYESLCNLLMEWERDGELAADSPITLDAAREVD